MSVQMLTTAQLRSAPAVLPVVVVIDVLRAFTTAAVALDKGADGVVLAGSPDEALRVRRNLPDALVVKDGAPEPGFDGVNSPVLLGRLDVGGRPVVLSTSCGTVGALAAEASDVLLCASFVVAGGTASYLQTLGRAVTFVITGDDGQASEDQACARYIAELLDDRDVDPEPYLYAAAQSGAAARLLRGVKLGYRGVHHDDVSRCLQLDRFPFAMLGRREEHGLVLRAVS
ncbi:2-phosphosulfolactate phosphatase [Actinoplanes sp. NPDC049118]|uniref:2-phosphosulfolactate phosphatase n=1 Tax=Actinoplanes sp. NPDC049118 TaxID=3155769 RepID=UPI0033C8544A